METGVKVGLALPDGRQLLCEESTQTKSDTSAPKSINPLEVSQGQVEMTPTNSSGGFEEALRADTTTQITHLQQRFSSYDRPVDSASQLALTLPVLHVEIAEVPLANDSTSTPRSRRKCTNVHCNSIPHKTDLNCIKHGGGQRCIFQGCASGARGSSKLCKKHGGGRRCTEPSCTSSAIDMDKCIRHGGGKRCLAPGCTSSAIGKIQACKKHGGGQRCIHPGCAAISQGPTALCRHHGGGKRCGYSGCSDRAEGKTYEYCRHHSRQADPPT